LGCRDACTNECNAALTSRCHPNRLPSPSFGLVGREHNRPARSCNLAWLWAKPVAGRATVALSSMAGGYFKSSFSFFPVLIQIIPNFGISYLFEYRSKIHEINSAGFLNSSSIHKKYQTK
jgi:hypothetical protein